MVSLRAAVETVSAKEVELAAAVSSAVFARSHQWLRPIVSGSALFSIASRNRTARCSCGVRADIRSGDGEVVSVLIEVILFRQEDSEVQEWRRPPRGQSGSVV